MMISNKFVGAANRQQPIPVILPSLKHYSTKSNKRDTHYEDFISFAVHKIPKNADIMTEMQIILDTAIWHKKQFVKNLIKIISSN
jgi:hypothetical protein